LASADSRAIELAAIERELGHTGYELRFAPRLEAAYQAARGPDRTRAITRYLLIYLAAKILFLFCNLRIGTHVFGVAIFLRLAIVLPLTLLSIYLLRRPLPAWVHGIAAFSPLVAETALVLLLGRLSGGVFTDRYVFAAAIGVFAQTLLMRAPFRHTVVGLAATLCVFCTIGLIPWHGHFGAAVPIEQLIFVVGLSLPALYERHARERAGRRDFLQSETNRLRLEDILRMNAHLERLSSIDGLTGIFNRRYLDAALQRLCSIALQKERWIGVLMIDIDHFKSLNDTAGHQHGDFCLEQVAQLLQQSVRAGVDTVARYGGEEFVAILPDANADDALTIAERVRRAVEDAGLAGAMGTVVTISTGAAAFRGGPGAQFTAVELIATADEALYQAKQSGRNRVVTARASLQGVSL
jgi:diguanylate cyclase (GGDEF)-like protein